MPILYHLFWNRLSGNCCISGARLEKTGIYNAGNLGKFRKNREFEKPFFYWAMVRDCPGLF
jgi:hypothetical protein